MCQTSNHDQSDPGTPLPLANEPSHPLFPLGQIVATPGVLNHLDEHSINPVPYIRRHQCGDWGDVPPEDASENHFSVLNRLRVLSAYKIAGERVWIITEADRSATTLLFPSEY